MNLAFCLFNYFPYGGLQRDFIRIAEECLRRGHTVDVYTMCWDGPNELQLPVTLIKTPHRQNHTRANAFVKKMQSLLTKKNYHLRIGFNKIPGLDLYYAADTCFQAKARKKHSLLYRLTPRYRHLVNYEKAVFSDFSKTQILLLSQLQQEDFIYYYNTPLQRFHLLPPGIAKDRMAPPNASTIRLALRNKLNIADDAFILLMVGSGFKTKGLDRILDGVAQLPSQLKHNCHLIIIGEDNKDQFLRQAKTLNISNHVNFLGGRSDVPDFLIAADVLLHPAYNENTGTVLLEALAAGLPVLTTDVCGYAHYIQEANAGYVLPSPFEQKVFNVRLQAMLSSQARLKDWKTNALEFCQHADIYSLPQRAVDIIERLGP